MTEIILNNLNNNLFDILLHSRSRTTDNIAIKCVRTQTGRIIAVAKWIEWNKAFNFRDDLPKNLKIKWQRLFWIIWTTIFLTFYCIPGAEGRTILRSSMYKRKRVVQLQLPSELNEIRLLIFLNIYSKISKSNDWDYFE